MERLFTSFPLWNEAAKLWGHFLEMRCNGDLYLLQIFGQLGIGYFFVCPSEELPFTIPADEQSEIVELLGTHRYYALNDRSIAKKLDWLNEPSFFRLSRFNL